MSDRAVDRSGITAALHDEVASLPPPSLESGLAAAARRTRQRRRWRVLATRQALVLDRHPVFGSRPVRMFAIVATLVVTVIVAVGATVGASAILPTTVSLPRNGAIAITAADGDRSVIWLVAPDGTAARPLNGEPGEQSGPHWSPDGSRIAYWSSTDTSVDLVIADQTGEIERTMSAPAGWLLPGADGHAGWTCSMEIGWSLDGRELAIPVVRAGETRYMPSMAIGHGPHPVSIAVLDVSSGAGRVLDPGTLVWSTRFWGLTDGTFAVQGETDLVAVDPVTGSTRVLAPGVGDHSCDQGRDTDVLPDGTAAITVRQDLGSPGRPWSSTLEVVPFDRPAGTNALARAQDLAYVCCPRVSPDGQRVAFLEGTDRSNENDVPRLFIADLAVGSVRSFVDHVLGPPAWSPDGTRVLVGTTHPWTAAVLNVDTGDLTDLPGGLEPHGVQGDPMSWQAVRD